MSHGDLLVVAVNIIMYYHMSVVLYFGVLPSCYTMYRCVDILLVTYLRPNTKTITNKSTDNAKEIV